MYFHAFQICMTDHDSAVAHVPWIPFIITKHVSILCDLCIIMNEVFDYARSHTPLACAPQFDHLQGLQSPSHDSNMSLSKYCIHFTPSQEDLGNSTPCCELQANVLALSVQFLLTNAVASRVSHVILLPSISNAGCYRNYTVAWIRGIYVLGLRT